MAKKQKQEPCYRDFLRSTLVERCRRNSGYSLRSFARDLAIAPSSLSNILSGRKSLSRSRAFLIADRLRLTQSEKRFFCGLVELETAKNSVEFSEVSKKLAHHFSKSKNLDLEIFKAVAEWHHAAIVELIDLMGAEFTISEAARRLGISRHVIKDSLDRLITLKIIIQDPGTGLFKKAENFVVTSNNANLALCQFHRQIFEKAMQSLDQDSPEWRYTASETLAFSAKDLSKVRRALDILFEELKDIARKSRSRNAVYTFIFQGFPLSQKGEQR